MQEGRRDERVISGMRDEGYEIREMKYEGGQDEMSGKWKGGGVDERKERLGGRNE